MAYKFCSYIDKIYGANYVDKYIDLVSLGLIADMMD
jgi:single-stranded DNA-specific DHH superfamily exonuclease